MYQKKKNESEKEINNQSINQSMLSDVMEARAAVLLSVRTLLD